MKLLTIVQTAALLVIAGASVFAGTTEPVNVILP
jgi:hypothetical protein